MNKFLWRAALLLRWIKMNQVNVKVHEFEHTFTNPLIRIFFIVSIYNFQLLTKSELGNLLALNMGLSLALLHSLIRRLRLNIHKLRLPSARHSLKKRNPRRAW